jgi:histone deacetylase complex regulatory component SIN3
MPGHQSAAPQKQPVEFDQAINYVNKIKVGSAACLASLLP